MSITDDDDTAELISVAIHEGDDVARVDTTDTVSGFMTSDGVGLRVAERGAAGSGPTLVLVHGWSQDLRTWDRVVDDLDRAGWTGRILRHDHRGHGGSTAAPTATATITQAADDLAEILADRVPEGPIVLAGHSMGGMTLMALAERHPRLVADRVAGAAFVATASDGMAELTLGLEGPHSRRVGRLVARGEHLFVPLTAHLGHRAPAGEVGTGSVRPAREEREDREEPRTEPRPRFRAALLAPGVRALVFGRRPRRADVLAVAEQALAAHPPTVAGFRRSIAAHGRRAALEAVRGTPSVVLVGDHDRLCPPRHARAIAEALPQAEIVLLPGAGHMITYERSVEVAAHLQGLLDAASTAVTTDQYEEPVRASA